MITKNAAFIFDLLTINLSRSKAFETMECSKKTNSNAGAGFGRILNCCNQKIIRIVMSRSFFKKISSFFMLIKEQNNSNQSSLLKWLPKNFQINVFIFFTRKIMVVLAFKIVCFLNKQWLIELLTLIFS